MAQPRGQHYSRFGILALVIGGHVLLVMLFNSVRGRESRTPQSSSLASTVVVLLDLQPAPVVPSETLLEPSLTSSSSIPLREPRPRESANADEPASTAITEPSASAPEINWQLEAERTAQGMGEKLLKDQQRKCTEPQIPGLPPPECRKRKYDTKWEPEPKRAGFEGGIPYVRIGKRCIVGLGFLGCAIGKLPEADGDLFDDMRDPDRPRSSVPDIDEINKQ